MISQFGITSVVQMNQRVTGAWRMRNWRNPHPASQWMGDQRAADAANIMLLKSLWNLPAAGGDWGRTARIAFARLEVRHRRRRAPWQHLHS